MMLRINRKSQLRKGSGPALALLLGALYAGCAGNPPPIGGAAASSGTSQTALAQAATAAFIDFQYSNFYSITNPNPQTSCAGDATTYYDPSQALVNGIPQVFPTSNLFPGTTIKPSFIKNVSVDLTDANSNLIANNAVSCSYGGATRAPASSACSSFDYGAIGGVPASLGGTVLLFGGVEGNRSRSVLGYNYHDGFDGTQFHGLAVGCGPAGDPSLSGTNFTQCSNALYALAIDTLSPSIAASGPSSLAPGVSGPTGQISSWQMLSAVSGYSGPSGVAGAAGTFDPGTQQVLVFGGAAPLTALNSAGPGTDTVQTWIYDLKSQTWLLAASSSFTAPNISTNLDQYGAASGGVVTNQISKSTLGRSLQGYAALPYMGLSALSTNGSVPGNYTLDPTERIITVGGLVAGGGVATYSYKFNPTYGPDLVDALKKNGGFPAADTLVQWADSFHTQLLSDGAPGSCSNTSYATPSTCVAGGGTWTPGSCSNTAYTSLAACAGGGATWTYTDGQFHPAYTTHPNGDSQSYAFGLARGMTNIAGSEMGVPIAIGGFDASVAKIPDVTKGGILSVGVRANDAQTLVPSAANGTTELLAVPDNPSGTELKPMKWVPIPETATQPGTNAAIPWYGSATALPGFDLTQNDVVYFGGSSCRDYLTDGTLIGSAPACRFDNPGLYVHMGADLNTNGTAAPVVAMAGAAPQRAGLAAARGQDLAGNTIIVAWGGMDAPASVATANPSKVFYLYNNGGTPTWVTSPAVTTTYPIPAANASMVYSHVTGKFYLFGGYQTAGSIVTSGDTWELSVDPAVNGGNCSAGSCGFKWRKLNVANGLTCSPSCPPARRSHRMVEVNYNNTTPTAEPTCTNADSPCSFGIFMEGGSPDGFNILSDRWVFDPTANGGWGHWQQVNDFPPRRMAAVAAIDYYVPAQSKTVHRAIAFGGEMGMQNGAAVAAGNFFVAPTLGDTQMYDFDSQSWNRVELLGKGYYNPAPTQYPAQLSAEYDKRQSFYLNGANALEFLDSTTLQASSTIQELSPPPLSGAVMVARTLPSGTLSSTGVTPLAIPEVFLFGGRTKDGRFLPLDHVYKFCAGSTGEKIVVNGAAAPQDTDTAACDAYDINSNPSSPSPSQSYIGRWLRKQPPTVTIDPTLVGSFLGAGAYDTGRDRIVLFGGLSAANMAGDSVNSVVGAQVTIPTVGGKAAVLEYTPPSKVNAGAASAAKNGTWDEIPSCTTATTSSGAVVLQTPTPRYGHTLAFDSLNQQLVLIGGFDASGTPLVTTGTDAQGNAYTIPEVWTAKRMSTVTDASPQYTTITSAVPCYLWTPITIFGNSNSIATQVSPYGGMAVASSAYIPATGYNTGYYSMFDQFCAKAGPIANTDPNINKLLAGGAYIDIDRTQLGPKENVILNLTYIPLGTQDKKPDGSNFQASEVAVFRVHLVKTGQSEDMLQSTPQPRYLTYADTAQFPEIVQSLSVLAPPDGVMRQEQILIPLAADPLIDRIRIERYSGSGILVNASIYRLGVR